MQSIKHDLYDAAFELYDMEPARDADRYNPEGSLYRFQDERSSGEYWAYFRDNLFAVNVFDLRFHASGTMRYRHTEHLCIAYYERNDLVVRGLPLSQGSHVIGTYVADEGGEYLARFDAGAVARATSITISPDYYRRYLLGRFGSIPDIRRMVALVDGSRNFPALVALFKRMREYRGTGIAAEGKTARRSRRGMSKYHLRDASPQMMPAPLRKRKRIYGAALTRASTAERSHG